MIAAIAAASMIQTRVLIPFSTSVGQRGSTRRAPASQAEQFGRARVPIGRIVLPRSTVLLPYSAILIGVVVFFIIATVPVWPYSRTWGLWPSGALGLLLVILVGLLVLG
ncbi:DUF3309 family protein [Microvirga roseola]|uniref:DUF3309 family protein n=1 Tax=Microvirga roseola TaxID=2883126 RepID=UPI001E544ED6|nr:DUF3309 family protein [Microvirga roseola]